MKNLIIYVFTALSCSCSFSEKITNVKTDDPKSWKSIGNVLFSDTAVTLTSNSSIRMSNTFKNFELNFECKTEPGSIGAVYFHTKDGNLNTGYEVMINNNLEIDEWSKTGGLTAVRNFGKRTCNNEEWLSIKISNRKILIAKPHIASEYCLKVILFLIPSFKFIKLAKQKGVKFTFGTNNANTELLENMEYLIAAIHECRITASDIFIPVSKNF